MTQFDKKFIGKTLKELRRNAGLTQYMLAEKVGLSEKHISKIEQGTNLPTLDNFLRIAEVLNFNIPEFGISNSDSIKDKLYKLIALANDAELKLYYDIISAAKINLDEIKNVKF